MSRLSLWKRCGVYYVGYYLPDRMRHWKSTGCRTKPEALQALTRFKELLAEKRGGVLLSVFIKELLAYSEANHATRTFKLFRQVLGTFLVFCGDISLTHVTSAHVDRYKTERLRNIKPVSVTVELRMLKAAFSVGVRWKHIV